MPRRDANGEPIFPGTPYSDYKNGAVKQVILNRYLNNRYPDAIAKACKQERYSLLPFLFEPREQSSIKCASGKSLLDADRQFIDIEPETEEWFAHWPEELPYTGELKALFDATNAHRVGIGKGKMTGPLRGYETYAAMRILAECRRIKDIAHESDEFAEGYQRVQERVYKDGLPIGWRTEFEQEWGSSAYNVILVPLGMIGENLVFGTNYTGIDAFDAWMSSPGHKANIERDWTVETTYLAEELQLGIGSLDGETQYSQVFVSRHDFVEAGCNYWEGELGRVTWNGPPSRYGFTNYARFSFAPYYDRWFTDRQSCNMGGMIYINGRQCNTGYLGSSDGFESQVVLGAALYKSEDSIRVRVASIYQGEELKRNDKPWDYNYYRPIHILVMTCALEKINNEIVPEWIIEADIKNFSVKTTSTDVWLLDEIEWHLPRISPQVYFSADGTKFIIGKTASNANDSDGPPFYGAATQAWAEYFEYSDGALSLVERTSESNLVFALDYIGNTRAAIRVNGNTLGFPSGRTFNAYRSATDFSVLLYADMQNDVVVDFQVSPEGSDDVRLKLRVNEIIVSEYVLYNVQESGEPDGLERKCFYPRTVDEGPYSGKYFIENQETLQAYMPPIGMFEQTASVDYTRGLCDVGVAYYKGEIIVCVYVLQLPFDRFQTQEVDEYVSYSTLDLDTLVGAGPLLPNLFPMGVM